MRRSAHRTLLALLLGIGLLTAGLARADDSPFLTVDAAFKVGATSAAPDMVEVIFQVHPGYYLYRGRLKFAVPAGQGVSLGTVQLPNGEKKVDEYFGEQEVYHHDFTARLPVARSSKGAFQLKVQATWQGCAEAGLCYPPVTRIFVVDMPAATSNTTGGGGGGTFDGKAAGGSGYVSEQDRLTRLIGSGNVLLMIVVAFGYGLLLSITPCVLPMVPIVTGLIVGSGTAVRRGRAFTLSVAYVLGMAATYTAAGMAVAAAGHQAQTLFQKPWIIWLFSALFVAMAISMFGFFTVQMPAAIQTRLASISNRQKAGSYAGVVVMGALSALIVTTCVGPALVAALSVIGQSGQMARGGLALFSMAIGMGVPLLVVGASAGQLLPRAGAWMDTVKQAVGALMLAVAVWMLSRILPARATMWLWAAPLLALAIIFGRASFRTPRARAASRAVAALALLAALLIGYGAAQGITDPLHPLRPVQARVDLPFQRIKSLADLDAQVTAANAAGKTVMLDFYADWCVSCKEMEHQTFPVPAVRTALANTVWLQADVTANDATDQALLQHFAILGPPTIAFYGTDGRERRQFRVVGYMKAAEFAPLVQKALAPQ